MENQLPLLMCCSGFIVWSVLLVVAGRWSVSHRVCIERRADQPANGVPSPYYENFEEV